MSALLSKFFRIQFITSAQFVSLLLSIGCSPQSSSGSKGFIEAQIVSQSLRSYFVRHGYSYFDRAESRRWLHQTREDYPLQTKHLSADHMAAIRAYTSGDNQLYRQINQALKSESPELLRNHVFMVRLLNESLDLLPIDPELEQATLYRRLPESLLDRYTQYDSGQILVSKGFTSTSRIDYDILGGEEERSLLLELAPSSEHSKGRSVAIFSAYPFEEEVLFPPGMAIEITERLVEQDWILDENALTDFVIKGQVAYHICP